MSSVNHEAAGDQTSTELVAEAQMQTQQQDAATETATLIPSQVPPVHTQTPQVKPVEKAIFHELEVSILVTLNLVNPLVKGRKKALSAFDTGAGDVINLYSPFRIAQKPKDGKAGALAGVLRGALSPLLDVTDDLNSSRIKMVGKESETIQTLRKSVTALKGKFEASLPLQPSHVVASFVADDEDQIDLTFADIVRVGSWINSPSAASEAGELDAIATHNGVISLTVASGAVYDSEEKYKTIGQAQSVLERILEQRGGGSTQLLLAVMLDPSDLAEPDYRDLLSALLEEGGFSLYTRNELNRGDAANWLPMTKAEVARELLAENGEMLLLKLIGEDEDEEEAGDAAGDDATDDAAAE